MNKKNKCANFFTGCVSVDDENSVDYYSISENSFSKIETDGRIPIAIDIKKGLSALKGMNEDGIFIEVRRGETVHKVELDSETSSVVSACFLEDSSLVMLQIDEKNTVERSYIISVSDPAYKKWLGYKVSEENTRELFSRLLSLGAVINRPEKVECYGENIYLISHKIFSDMMNIEVQKLDRSSKELNYVSGYHPVKNNGRISIHFQEKDNTLYVYSGNQLTTVKGLHFPVTRTFNEPGEILFFNDMSSADTFLYFIPDNKAPGESEIRKIRF